MSIFSFFGGSGNGITNLSSDEFAAAITTDTNAVILDVRTDMEYDMGHIPGAQLLDITDPRFFDKVGKLDKTKSYYVYCRSGSRSAQACRMMQKEGLANVYNLTRGTIGWQSKLVTDKPIHTIR